MKTLGRIILFLVGGFLIGYGIYNIVTSVNAFNASPASISTVPEKIAYIVLIVFYAIYILVGIPALFASLRGKASFWLYVFALIMIASVIVRLIMAYSAGTLTSWQQVLNIILGFTLPIAYFIGTVLIKFPSKK